MWRRRLKRRRILIASIFLFLFLVIPSPPLGYIQAHIDLLLNRPRYLTYGLTIFGSSSGSRLLLTKYGIRTDEVAGCTVDEGTQMYAKTYNSIIKQALARQYGHDVIHECVEQARLKTTNGAWPR